MRMRQISFSGAEHEGKKRVTRREKFLGEMEQVVPWSRLLGALEPYYPKGTRGRPPIGLERMLRLYFVQQWYALSDEGLEDAVSDSAAIRQFVGIDLGHEEAPDATTVLKFRRLLEAHKLTAVLLEEINAHLRERGLMMHEGTMVDAPLIQHAVPNMVLRLGFVRPLCTKSAPKLATSCIRRWHGPNRSLRLT